MKRTLNVAALVCLMAGITPASAEELDRGRDYESLLKGARGQAALALGVEIGEKLAFKDPERARRLMAQASRQSASASDHGAWGRLHRWMGNSFLIQDQLEQAESWYRRALPEFRKVDDLEGLLGTKLNLGIIARRRGDFAQAIRLNREVIRINETFQDRRWTHRASNNIAVVFEQVGLDELSLEYLVKAREAALATGEKSSASFWNAARRSADLGLHAQAERFINEAYSALTPQTPAYWRGALYSAHGYIHNRAGRYEAAEDVYRRAYDLFAETGSSMRRAWAMCGIAFARFERKSFEGMAGMVEGCRDAATENNNTPQLIEANDLYVRLLQHKGDHKEAASVAAANKKIAVAYFERITKQRVAIAVAEIEEEFNRQAVKIAEQEATLSTLVAQRQRILLYVAMGAIASFVLLTVTLIASGRARRKANLELQRTRDYIASQNAELAESVSQRETLLKELNHRVKNNLQVIASLLGLERRRAEADGEDIECLKNVQAQVISMASIHEGLQETGSAEDVDLADYLGRLAERLANVHGDRCFIQVKAEADWRVSLSKAAPIGLIICELVSNAEKHAYDEHEDVRVDIEFKGGSPGGAVLHVSDLGRGVPSGESLDSSNALGLSLVRDLSRQIGARLSWRPNKPRGIVWTLVLLSD